MYEYEYEYVSVSVSVSVAVAGASLRGWGLGGCIFSSIQSVLTIGI